MFTALLAILENQVQVKNWNGARITLSQLNRLGANSKNAVGDIPTALTTAVSSNYCEGTLSTVGYTVNGDGSITRMFAA